MTENNRRARIYRLTDAGREQLDVEAATYNRVTLTISHMMQTD